MQNLTAILNTLEKVELSLLESYYQNLKGKGYEKRQKLVSLYKQGDFQNDTEACRALYNKDYSAAFSRLKEKVILDICRVVLLFQNPESLSSLTRVGATVESRMLSSTGEVFIGRNAREEGASLLNKAEKIAERYELIPEMISILDILSGFEGFNKGIDKFEKLQSKVASYMTQLQEVTLAQRHYFSILLPSIFRNHEAMQEYNPRIGNMIQEVENMENFEKSAFIKFFYYHLKIFQCELNEDYKALETTAEHFLELLQSSPALNCKPYKGGAYLQLANASLMQGSHENAILHANHALKQFKKGNKNELQVLEVIFLAGMQMENLAEAEKALKRALDNPNTKVNRDEEGYSFTFEKWQIYKAFYQYKNQEYKQVRIRLSRIRRLLRDSIYWYFSVGLLEVYTDIATGNNPSDKIAALEKQLQRKKNPSERLKTIIPILACLNKNDLNFDQTEKEKKEALNNLSVSTAQYAFNPWKGEVIPFEEWFYGYCKEGIREV